MQNYLFGVFIERVNTSLWRFKENNTASVIDIWYYATPIPLLFSIEYKLLHSYSSYSIVDFKKIPLNEEIQRLYFADCTVKDNIITPNRKSPFTKDAYLWMKFEGEVILQRLVPTRDFRMYLKLVKKGDFETLIRTCGIVNLCELARYVGSNNRLFAEAVNISILTSAMKKQRSVWFKEDENPPLVFDEFSKDILKTMIKENVVIVDKETKQIGLAWAISIYNKFKTSVHCTHETGAPLQSIQNCSQMKEVKADFNLPVDNFIDRGQLPTSMFCDLTNQIEILSAKQLKTKHGVTDIAKKMLFDVMKTLFSKSNGHVLVFSSAGNYNYHIPNVYSCIGVQKNKTPLFGKSTIVAKVPLFVTKTSQFKLDMVNEQPSVNLRFTDLEKYLPFQKDIDDIVGIFETDEDIKWLLYMEMFISTKKTYLFAT